MAGHLVAVSPPAELAARPRLFGALEEALAVRFEAREAGSWRGASAAVLLDGQPLDGDPGLPFFRAVSGEQERPATTAIVEFASEPAVDRRLRGRALPERHGLARSVSVSPGDVVLASSGSDAAWVARGRGRIAAAAPAELAPAEPLRDRLRPDRFLGLLPLVQFLREVSEGDAWTPPPLRATFILDDPNLHLRSYGHVRYEELARAAKTGGYHVAIAMVPLDGWFAHPGAVRIFREQPEHLSVVVHGNDHLREELARPIRDDEALIVVAQALRRIEAFERRTGIPVARVMTPPHGRCSEVSMRALLRTGFEAACVSRPYPWLDRPPADRPLAAWEPADFVANGLPVLPRYPLASAREDVVLRAFLDQPLILYGHHWDLVEGPGALTEAAIEIDRLGPVAWVSPGELARTNFAVRVEGNELHVKLYARRVQVVVPDGIDRIVPHLPGSHDGPEEEAGLEPRSVGPGSVEVALRRLDAVDASGIPLPGWRPWPLARRLLTESRDRIHPLVSRVRVQARARS